MDFLTDTDDTDDFLVPNHTKQGHRGQAGRNVSGGLTSLFTTGDNMPSGTNEMESNNDFKYRTSRKTLILPKGD